MGKRVLDATVLWAILAATLASASFAFGKVIHVPTDQPTIQSAIDVAVDGDRVLVSPGTYTENIKFMGKAITVNSVSGPKLTIIDGGQIDSAVSFSSGEARGAMLSGFTVTKGVASDGGGIAICCLSSPTIVGNVITANSATEGGGIYVIAGSPLIQDSTISRNTGIGAGIAVENGASGLEIVGNKILANTSETGDAGGMLILAFGSTLIRNNLIAGNTAKGVFPASHGGGVYLRAAATDIVLSQNVIVGNAADQGGGLYLEVGGTETPIATVVNNTIAGNDSPQQGSAIYVIGLDSGARLFNNMAIGRHGENAVFCDSEFDPNPPILKGNNVFSPQGTDYEGNCSGETGSDGNISVAPRFVDALHRNFHLKSDSAAIDAGKNAAPDLPKKDFSGKPRIMDGNGDGKSLVDMGAYEVPPQ